MRERRTKGAGSISKRRLKDGSVAYLLRYATYARVAKGAATKKQALAMLPAFVHEIQSGEIARKKAEAERLSKQPTLAEWSTTFLSSHVSQDADRAATRAAYASMLRLYILPTLGKHKLTDITAPMIRESVQDLYRRGRALRTIKLAYAVLHRCFDAAQDDGYLKENPMPKFAKLRLGETENAAESAKRHALTVAEVTALLAATAGDPELHLWVSVMASCGLRPGEANALGWADIDLKTNELRVRGSAKKVYGAPGENARVWIGKTKTPSGRRTVSFGPALAALFIAERERQERVQRELLGRDPNVRDLKSLLPPNACVFCADPAMPDGLTSPRSPNSLRSQFQRMANKAGLPHISPHWLRHTAISHAIAQGTSLADVSRRAGHKNPAITAAIYTHAVNEGEQKAAAIGDSLLAPTASAEVEQIGADKGLK